MPTPDAQYAFRYFLDQGWQPHQAAGFVGRLMQESGRTLNPTALGDQGTAFGIAQWRNDRQQALREFAASQGRDVNARDTQLAFIPHELQTREKTAWQMLQSAKDLPAAVNAAMAYERPQGWKLGVPGSGHGYDNTLRYAAQLQGVDPATLPRTDPGTSYTGAPGGSMDSPGRAAFGSPAPAPVQPEQKFNPGQMGMAILQGAQRQQAQQNSQADARRRWLEQMTAQAHGSGIVNEPRTWGLLGGG